MSMPFDLLAMQRVPGSIVALGILVALAVSLIARDRRDRDRILDEADLKDAEVLSIHWCWLPFRYGPFAWYECLWPGCRVYRVRARERSESERTAYVLIGPRRFVSRWESWDSREEQWYGTLTWRWAEPRRPAGR